MTIEKKYNEPQFAAAVSAVSKQSKIKVDDADKLRLYSYYKIATGSVESSKGGSLNPITMIKEREKKRALEQALNEIGNDKDDAVNHYIDLTKRLGFELAF